MYGFIYITTNNINGKKYIGKKKYGRKHEDYLGSGKLLKQAILKYGRENFSREIVAEAEDNDKLNELERFYIRKYNAQQSNMFYNISEGGDWGDVTRGMSEEQYKRYVEKISNNNKWKGKKRPDHSKLMSGKGNSFYGKKHSEETKNKIRETKKGTGVGKDNPFYGKKHSEETKNKIREKALGRKYSDVINKSKGRSGKDNKASIGILIEFNNEKVMEFESLTEAMKSLSISQYILGKIINGDKKNIEKYNIKSVKKVNNSK